MSFSGNDFLSSFELLFLAVVFLSIYMNEKLNFLSASLPLYNIYIYICNYIIYIYYIYIIYYILYIIYIIYILYYILYICNYIYNILYICNYIYNIHIIYYIYIKFSEI